MAKDKTVSQPAKDGIKKVYDALADGRPAREVLPSLSKEEAEDVGRLGLLTGMKVRRLGVCV